MQIVLLLSSVGLFFHIKIPVSTNRTYLRAKSIKMGLGSYPPRIRNVEISRKSINGFKIAILYNFMLIDTKQSILRFIH